MALNLTGHILLRLFVPLIIGVVIISLITILPISIQTSALFETINEQMSNISKASTVRRVSNGGNIIVTLLEKVNNDINTYHDYTLMALGNTLPINNYYKTFYGVSTIDTTVPNKDKDGYSISSTTFKKGFNNLNELQNIQYMNETSIIDNIYRSIYKSSTLYTSMYLGLSNGLFRRYPYAQLNNYETFTYKCTSDNMMVIGYEPKCRNWYTQSENNDRINYSPPYLDAFSSKSLITVSKRIILNNNLVGVIAIDFKMDQIDDVINTINVIKNGYNFMVNKNGLVISYPNLDRTIENNNIFVLEPSITTEIFNSILHKTPDEIILKKNNENWGMSYIYVNDDYILISIYPSIGLYSESYILNNKLRDIIIYGVIIILCILILLIVTTFILNTIIGHKYASNINRMSKMLLGITSNEIELKETEFSSEFNVLKNNLKDLRTAICYGNNAFFEGNLDKALQNYKSALLIFERTKNIKGLSMCYNNIANVHKQLNQVKDALDLYQKSIGLVEQLIKSAKENDKIIEYKIMLANRYMNIGVLHKDANDYDLAMEYFDKSSRLNRETDNVEGIAKVNNNLGQLLLQQGKITEAEEQINNTYEIISSRENIDSISLQYCIMSMGILEFYKINYPKSIEWLCRIFDYKNTNVYIQQTCLEYLDNSYVAIGQLDIAIEIRKLKKQNIFSKNVYFVLDCSGSMSGEPIKQCKKSIKEIISSNLNGNDNVSLITFDTTCSNIFNHLNKDSSLHQIFNDIDTKVKIGGSTAFYDALYESLQLSKGLGDNWIVALTDGEDNSSKRSPQAITQIIESNMINIIIITVGPVKTENIIKGFCNSCKKKGGKGIHIKSESNNNKSISEAFYNVAKILTGQLNVDSL